MAKVIGNVKPVKIVTPIAITNHLLARFREMTMTLMVDFEMPNIALKPTRFRYAPAVGLALRSARAAPVERFDGCNYVFR